MGKGGGDDEKMLRGLPKSYAECKYIYVVSCHWNESLAVYALDSWVLVCKMIMLIVFLSSVWRMDTMSRY
ncbi:uncharacterized protein LAJ45_04091 [Morchella importuna]|uniref:uncharacterized protein n=1 Tax=Morchella importuna TaxID=1174673 RepID=UPI001E8DF2B7|nr:uncharacterized protein LAJ45_04091 [Morchella importuna]KAH8152097.1 hypothetical protein LAJ45_04091 [Morchella importuna]